MAKGDTKKPKERAKGRVTNTQKIMTTVDTRSKLPTMTEIADGVKREVARQKARSRYASSKPPGKKYAIGKSKSNKKKSSSEVVETREETGEEEDWVDVEEEELDDTGLEKLYQKICRMNSDDHENELFKKKIIKKIIEAEQSLLATIGIISQVKDVCFNLSRVLFSQGVLIIVKDSHDLSLPNKINISVIVNEELLYKPFFEPIIAHTRIENIKDHLSHSEFNEEFSKILSEDQFEYLKINFKKIKQEFEKFKKEKKEELERTIASPFSAAREFTKDENDRSENVSVQLMDPNKESAVYDTQEECDSQSIREELDEKILINFDHDSKVITADQLENNADLNRLGMQGLLFEEGFDDKTYENVRTRIFNIDLFKGQSAQYFSIPDDTLIKMDALSKKEFDSIKRFIKTPNFQILQREHYVRLSELSNAHSQLSEGKIFKISYILKSLCSGDEFIRNSHNMLTDHKIFDSFSTVFAWCGKATLKSCDESVNNMRELFANYCSSENAKNFLIYCETMLKFKFEGQQIFLKTMYVEFVAQMIYKILVSLKVRPNKIYYGLTEMDIGTFLSTSVHCGTSVSTIRDVSLKITNDTIFSGGGKKMKGGAIDFDIEYLFSIYLNGVVSLFTTHAEEIVPINDLLSQFIIDLNIYGRAAQLWIAAQVGGGGQSCYGIGKKADFDARVYLTNGTTYENLIRHIIGTEMGLSQNVRKDGTLSKLSNYIHIENNDYFNPDGYRFVFDEYTFVAMFDRTQIRQHKPEGGKFPVRLISIDIVWKVNIHKTAELVAAEAEPIGYYYHYSGIFDLVVKEGYPYEEILHCIIHPYGKNETDLTDGNTYCPIFSMSCLTKTILETFSNLLNVLNRINTLKFVKDFVRLIDICDKAALYSTYDVNPIKEIFERNKTHVFGTEAAKITNTETQFQKYLEIGNEVIAAVETLISLLNTTPPPLTPPPPTVFSAASADAVSASVSQSPDIKWYSNSFRNLLVNPGAKVVLSSIDAVPHNYDDSTITIIKKDPAISVYVSWQHYDDINKVIMRPTLIADIENDKFDCYSEQSHFVKNMALAIHVNSVASSLASSMENSSSSSSASHSQEENYGNSGTVFSPFRINAQTISRQSSSHDDNYSATASSGGPGRKWGGNKKTRKYLKKTNLKKSRKQRKSKKRVSKSNRKTKRK